MSREFDERAECMVKQYDAIEAVPGVHLNGKLTLGENLADLGGLWLAWLAWLDKAEAAHVDMSAKTDGYTPDQRFWIAYAQQWCAQTRPEQLRTPGRGDPHAPDEYRTNTVLQDLPEFAKSFSCKKTAAMVSASRAGCGEHLRLRGHLRWGRSLRCRAKGCREYVAKFCVWAAS